MSVTVVRASGDGRCWRAGRVNRRISAPRVFEDCTLSTTPRGTIIRMRSLMTKSERVEIQRSLKSVAVEVLTIPPAIIIAWAVLLGLLASLFGLPGTQFTFDFIREAAGPIAVLQAKTLTLVGALSALAFVAGHYRIDALICHVADRIKADALRLARTWSLMLTGVRTLFRLPTSSVLPNSRQDGALRVCIGFVAGETPQLE